MAYILIDGYNLIGIAHDNLESVRNLLISQLKEYASIKEHDLTVVFDGWKSGQKDQTRLKTGNVTVIYSRLGEKADDAIKKTLASSQTPWIVVSSDREVADYAANKDFAAVSSAEFEAKLFSALKLANYADSGDEQSFDDGSMKYDDDEDDYSPAGSKGNPKKLSKKLRKKIQALRKL